MMGQHENANPDSLNLGSKWKMSRDSETTRIMDEESVGIWVLLSFSLFLSSALSILSAHTIIGFIRALAFCSQCNNKETSDPNKGHSLTQPATSGWVNILQPFSNNCPLLWQERIPHYQQREPCLASEPWPATWPKDFTGALAMDSMKRGITQGVPLRASGVWDISTANTQRAARKYNVRKE